jgi:hypothetical protein
MRPTEPKSSKTRILIAPADHQLSPPRRPCTAPIQGHQSTLRRSLSPPDRTDERLSLITLPTKEVAKKTIYARGKNVRVVLAMFRLALIWTWTPARRALSSDASTLMHGE